MNVPLVIHGGSGLPQCRVEKCVDLGVRKFNVNTEVRTAYIEKIEDLTEYADTELTDIISDSINAMRDVISTKIKQFAGITP